MTSMSSTQSASPIQHECRRQGNPHRSRPSRFGAVWFLIALVIGFSAFALPSTFPHWATLQTLLSTQAVVGVVALGGLFPLAAGEFDLSIAAIGGITALIRRRAQRHGSLGCEYNSPPRWRGNRAGAWSRQRSPHHQAEDKFVHCHARDRDRAGGTSRSRSPRRGICEHCKQSRRGVRRCYSGKSRSRRSTG